MTMTAAVRVQRAIERARQRGRTRVSVPAEVLTDLLVEVEAGRRTQDGLGQIMARLARRHPEAIPAE
jgi:hypothetical protein